MRKGKKPVLETSKERPKLDNRIAVRTSTRNQVRDFAAGLTGEYDDVLRFMLWKLRVSGEGNFDAGRRMQTEFEKLKEDRPDLFTEEE